MKFTLKCLSILLFLVFSPLWAVDKSPVGIWQGTLKGTKLRLVFEITEKADHSLTATLDSLDQEAEGIPVSQVTYQDGDLHLDVPSVKGSYEGRLDATGTKIEGKWSQGKPIVLDLKKILVKPKVPKHDPNTDLFTAKVHPNGIVTLFKNSQYLGQIIPQIFGQGKTSTWEYFQFSSWVQDPRFNAMAFLLSQNAQVGLSSSVSISGFAVHVRYRMTPLKDVQVINVRTAFFTPYDDWTGSPFKWGEGSGTIPVEHGINNTLASKALDLNIVGPRPKDGLTVQWTGQGLHGALQDNRTWTPDMDLTWDHDEPLNKTWVWKAGEEKDFDFTLELNRDIATSTQVENVPGNGFEGYWCGWAEIPSPKMNFHISLHIEKKPKGKWALHTSELDWNIWNKPEKDEIAVKGRTLHVSSADGNELTLDLDPTGQKLDGMNKTGKDVFPVHLHRGVDYLLPRVDADGKALTEYTYQQPQSLDDGWKVGDLNQSSFDPAMVKKGVDQILNGGFPNVQSLVLIQGGKLLMDEYFYGYTQADEHQLQSVTKSVLSILFGIAQDKGLVNQNEKLYDSYPEYRKRKDWDDVKNQITLTHMLTMTSGLPCDDWVGGENTCGHGMWPSPDWLDFVLSMPLNHKPGEYYAYCTSCLTPLGEIIARRSGMSIPDFAQKYLYDPLGIQAHDWWEGPNHVTETGGSHRLRPRDMAKLGLLYLDKGKWNGKQIVSEKWVEDSTKFHVEPKHGSTWGYGYLWWQSKGSYKGREIPYYFAGGKFGQTIFVVPELDMVCVMTGADDDLVMGDQDFFKAYILSAVK